MSVSGATVSAALVNAGDVWSCTVTPNDGYDDGPSTTVSVGPVGTSVRIARVKTQPVHRLTARRFFRPAFRLAMACTGLTPMVWPEPCLSSALLDGFSLRRRWMDFGRGI